MAMKRHDIIVVSDISVYHMCNEPPVMDIVIHTLSAPAATTLVVTVLECSTGKGIGLWFRNGCTCPSYLL